MTQSVVLAPSASDSEADPDPLDEPPDPELLLEDSESSESPLPEDDPSDPELVGESELVGEASLLDEPELVLVSAVPPSK